MDEYEVTLTRTEAEHLYQIRDLAGKEIDRLQGELQAARAEIAALMAQREADRYRIEQLEVKLEELRNWGTLHGETGRQERTDQTGSADLHG